MTPEEKIEVLREWLDGPGDIYSDDISRTAGYGDAMRQVRAIIDPPKPKWRESVDRCVKAFPSDPLGDVLMHLSALSAPKADDASREWHLAHIVAVCEAQVGDGWQADPDSNAYRCAEQDEYDVFHLLDPLAKLTAPLCWKRVGDRAAAWLRSLTDGGAE